MSSVSLQYNQLLASWISRGLDRESESTGDGVATVSKVACTSSGASHVRRIEFKGSSHGSTLHIQNTSYFMGLHGITVIRASSIQELASVIRVDVLTKCFRGRHMHA